MEKKPLIFVDKREYASGILNFLSEYDCNIELKMLERGDYILSDRVVVERKTRGDFVKSIMDQRIFKQIKDMKDAFEKPILLIEGTNVFESLKPNVIRGVLSSIAIEWSVPILWTRDLSDSAGLLYWIARKEQLKEKRNIAIRSKKKTKNLSSQQEFLVAGLPGINNVRARDMLVHFGTPERIFTAREKELMEIPGIGKKIAEVIRKILTERY